MISLIFTDGFNAFTVEPNSSFFSSLKGILKKRKKDRVGSKGIYLFNQSSQVQFGSRHISVRWSSQTRTTNPQPKYSVWENGR